MSEESRKVIDLVDDESPDISSIRSPATAAAAPRNILNTRRYRLRNRAREAARVSDGLNLNEDISLAELTRMAPPRDVDEEEAMLAEALKLSLEQADSDAAAAASPSREVYPFEEAGRPIMGQIDNPMVEEEARRIVRVHAEET